MPWTAIRLLLKKKVKQLMRPPAFTPRIIFFTAVCLIPFWAGAQSVDNAGQSLESVEQKLERKRLENKRLKAEAAKLKSEVKDLNVNMVQAASRVQEQEVKVLKIENELSDLSRVAKLKEDSLRQRGDQFSGVIMALTRMSRTPTEALIVQPMAPEDMVRSAILLRSAVPQLENSARALRDELDGLSIARAEVEDRKAILVKASRSLQDEQKALSTMIKRKTAMRAEAISKSRAASSQMRELSKKAKTLRELLSKIENSRAEIAARMEGRGTPDGAGGSFAPGLNDSRADSRADQRTDSQNGSGGFIGSISKARGQLPFPVVGTLVGSYGQDLGNGTSRKGISIETMHQAQVISPFDGKVVFSGPFRGYGQLLIIDHGEGYHSLLAGLGRIDAVLGNPVLAGEPVAVMNETGEQPVLYVEFRRDNEPVNPLPWLAERKGKNQG